MWKSDKNETFDVLFILFDVLIFVVVINYFRSSDLCHFRRCDVVVVINSKAIFDVLKKIASRSSEIRRSDPLPLFAYYLHFCLGLHRQRFCSSFVLQSHDHDSRKFWNLEFHHRRRRNLHGIWRDYPLIKNRSLQDITLPLNLLRSRRKKKWFLSCYSQAYQEITLFIVKLKQSEKQKLFS